MFLKYPQYYRKNGVWKEQQLTGFAFKPLVELAFPLRPVYHYLPLNTQERSLDNNDPFIQRKGGLLYCQHVAELKSEVGRPIRMGSINAGTAIRDLEKKNRLLRRVRQFDMVDRDLRSTLVINYALLQHLYRYPVNFMANYYRWQNIFATMIETINDIAIQSDRQHYIHINLPQHLPRLALLKMGENSLSKNVVESLSTYESMFLLDLWTWAGKKHGESLLSKIKPEALARVNLVVTDNGQGGVINLGQLDGWRKARAKTDGDVIDASMETFQRKVYYFFIQLAKLRAENVFTAVQVDAVEEDSDLPPVHDTDDESDSGSEAPGATVPERLKDTPMPEEQEAAIPEMSEKEADEYREELEALAEGAVDIWNDDLFELHIPGVELGQVGNESKAAIDLTAKPELGVIHSAERLLEHAMISGAEFRRFEKLANSYKSIENPFGQGTLADLIDVKDSDVSLKPERLSVTDHEAVTDKTMLRSTLLDFDKAYIKDVLHRDVARMIMSLQHSGVAVTSYEVERVKDALNKYDVITVKLVPVAGKPTTVRIELPVVAEDGSWVADGVKYRLRKQRGDCPIHKVAPDKVALTSYYGKLFVKRSEKAVHNYGRWLQNRIIYMSMGDNATVSKLAYKTQGRKKGSRLPRLYTILTSRFIGFTVNGWELNFDYDNRAAFFGADALAGEIDGLVVMGRREDNSKFLYVDDRDALYTTEDGKPMPVGDIGDLVGFDNNQAPIEQIEIKVAGKEIPLGFVFGYYFGLDELCRRLGVTPRRIPKGQKATLEHGEYSLRFKDETWALSRHDRKAALVLSGMNRFHRQMSHYSVKEFNRQDVYLNLLDGLGMTARQLRELDVLMLHFVDPITKTLLESYQEPTTFDGLLFRSVEMLQNDEVEHRPDRFKGYERIAGAVYRELAMALKQYHGKPVTSRASIDIKPNAVWNAIQSDPSITLVQDINPVHHLKEQEAVTFGGTGGRSSRTMVRSTRAYDDSDFGVVSEATVDSSEVAVNTYLSSDPNFTNLYGVTRAFDKNGDGLTSVLSTTGNLSPSIVHDDYLHSPLPA